jgi:hypothetical protein
MPIITITPVEIKPFTIFLCLPDKNAAVPAQGHFLKIS